MKIIDLKTLNMVAPLGVGARPYFSWIMASDERDTHQTSYRLEICDERGERAHDTGVIRSDKNAYIAYDGAPLKPRTIYAWKVSATDNHGNAAEAESRFETALDMGDWRAKWIDSPIKRKKSKPGFGKQDPATMFRQVFSLKSKPVKARLYATCHGVYELYVNGARPDERAFAPEHTVYGKHLCYQTYDVTELCAAGKNAIGMYVGDGWYHCPHTAPDMKNKPKAHAALYQLEVEYSDGAAQTFGSDASAKAAYGPILSSDLYAGELYDANNETPGWSAPEFDDSGWANCAEADYGYANLVAQSGEPVTAARVLPAQSVTRKGEGYIVDFGQNMAGRVRLKVDAPRGAKITLEHCEVLDKQGNYYNNILSFGGLGKGCDQKDEYISNGKPAVFEPKFTFHGFRYVKVTGMDVKPEDICAVALTSKKADIGIFETSDARLNRLYENIRWSQTSNTLSIPTDCPQREKAGWTGDMLVYAKTALLNEDCTAFFTRWLKNMSCDQDEYGVIPMVVPQVGMYLKMGKMFKLIYRTQGNGTSSGWGDAAVIVPYDMYQVTGNSEILKQQYDCMRGWVDYIISEAARRRGRRSKLPQDIEKYLWNTGYHYGEWLIPSQSKDGLSFLKLPRVMRLSARYTAPIFGWLSVSTFAKIAELLSKSEDAAKYGEIAEKMKRAIQQGVIQPDGSMPADLMGAYVLPIYFDLVPEQHMKTFADNLVRSIQENGGCMDTGFLASPYLLDALCKIGRIDLAYSLLWQNKAPSWLAEVDAGGTTIWENSFGYDADGNPGNLSFNHYAFGCVADWIFRKVAGIDALEAGFKRILIAPELDGKLTRCKRKFVSAQGAIECEWSIADNQFRLRAVIPCNSTAKIILPDGQTHEVGSGEYEYAIAYEN